eukprot:gene13630-16048_t
MSFEDIKDYQDHMIVTLPDTKTTPRSFAILNAPLYIRRYIAARPTDKDKLCTRFFLQYRGGHCINAPIGKNSFATGQPPGTPRVTQATLSDVLLPHGWLTRTKMALVLQGDDIASVDPNKSAKVDTSLTVQDPGQSGPLVFNNSFNVVGKGRCTDNQYQFKAIHEKSVHYLHEIRPSTTHVYEEVLDAYSTKPLDELALDSNHLSGMTSHILSKLQQQ